MYRLANTPKIRPQTTRTKIWFIDKPPQSGLFLTSPSSVTKEFVPALRSRIRSRHHLAAIHPDDLPIYMPAQIRAQKEHHASDVLRFSESAER